MATIVTGASGFIGRALVSALIQAGDAVIGIDRTPLPPQPGLTTLTAGPLPPRAGLTTLTADLLAGPQPPQPGLTTLIADLLAGDDAVHAALATADRVFHLAGCPGVRDHSPGIPTRRHRDNVLATARVLALVPSATPVVVTSSSSVYGGARHGRASAESDPLRPRGGYAESKIAAERLCLARLHSGGAVVVARPFTVAGEGQRPDMALAQWIAAARAGQPLRLLGAQHRTRDLTDVRDVARALIALTERGARGVVNIGTGVGHSLRAMVAAVGEALDVEVRTYLEPANPVEAVDTLADTRTLRRMIGWAPHTDLPDLVARQAAAQLVAPSGSAVVGSSAAGVVGPAVVGSAVAGVVGSAAAGSGPAGGLAPVVTVAP